MNALNYATLLGVPADSSAARWLPATYAFAAGLGLVLALLMKAIRPGAYVRMGVGTSPAAPPPPAAAHAATLPQGWLG
jgi:hypothetical protein